MSFLSENFCQSKFPGVPPEAASRGRGCEGGKRAGSRGGRDQTTARPQTRPSVLIAKQKGETQTQQQQGQYPTEHFVMLESSETLID